MSFVRDCEMVVNLKFAFTQFSRTVPSLVTCQIGIVLEHEGVSAGK